MDVRAERDHVRVAAVGELDLATAGPLDDTLRELDEAGTDRLVLDLRQLTFLDCTGLRSLLMAHARAAETGTELQVLCRPGPVSRLLALACADQTLDVVVSPAAVDPPAAITITDARA